MGKKSQNKKKKSVDKNKKKSIARPQSLQEMKEGWKVEAKDIKNKIKRVQVHVKRKALKGQIKMKDRKKRQKLPKE